MEKPFTGMKTFCYKNVINGDQIVISFIRYELVLAMALALIVNAPANYLIQYDEETAW
jgi:hypothetical protein